MTEKTWFITGAGRGMGADAIGIAEQKVAEIEEQIDACDELSSSLAHEDTTVG